jgi:UDP-N-acetylglucosamine 2-epimerase (non-hydrolysing)
VSSSKVHIVVGTRPEAIKLAPLVLALQAGGRLEPVVIATGQHTEMVVDALAAFGLQADVTLRLDRRTGEQSELFALLAQSLDRILIEQGSAAVVVQGDTTSALVGGLVAFWRGVRLVHLEAGLRSGSLDAPFPEEANRRLLGVVADLHLAPTRRAVDALLREHVDPDRILLVGNTVVDAVLSTAARTTQFRDAELRRVDRRLTRGARLMLVTAHRRESWGEPLSRILAAVEQIVDEHPDLHCVVPAHANPAVRAQVDQALAGHPRVVVTGPLPYPELCRLLSRSTLALSDSGGIQEEAPSFGLPLLVLREVTERMEAVDGGWAHLVGTDGARIVAAAKGVLEGIGLPRTAGNPFGDGLAAPRSAAGIAWLLGLGGRPAEFEASTLHAAAS